MGLSLPLPKTLYAHGFITLQGEKMSKSVGNVIKPKDIVDQFGVDALRYYLLRHIPSYDDGDFSIAKMTAVFNGELGNELGNLVQRIAAMINKYQDGTIGDVPPGEHDTGPYSDAVDAFRFDKALEYTFSLVRGLNQYIDEEKPWEIAASDPAHLQEILAYSVGSLLQISDLLDPFMPATAASIRKTFEHGVVDQSPALFPRIETPAETEA
jgi:methionyl-tRNA synthetase